MIRNTSGLFTINPPATVTYNGYVVPFTELTREEWDELGYNEAVPLKREPFTTYETRWVKGGDLIYREEATSVIRDTSAFALAEAAAIRAERDTRLRASDWTQLVDSTLDDEAMVQWQGYRQALRDVPQQDGFPDDVEWPDEPAME